MSKYIVLITKNPYGYDDGFKTFPATSQVFNNKIFDNKEEAESAAHELRIKESFDEIEKQMHISKELFETIRYFIAYNKEIDVAGNVIKSDYSIDKLITIFINMFRLDIDYNEIKYKHDEELYANLYGDEPIIKVVELE